MDYLRGVAPGSDTQSLVGDDVVLEVELPTADRRLCTGMYTPIGVQCEDEAEQDESEPGDEGTESSARWARGMGIGRDILDSEESTQATKKGEIGNRYGGGMRRVFFRRGTTTDRPTQNQPRTYMIWME